ncbi:hypothetical protein NWF24_17830 [Variovorax paradoxus]|uniref:hypothetical protein n=1 Tax=Variovorax paradoxus TaxID=34073 RepID=UPI0021AD1944|nr:hypothetical protein [Variovorax paradoxus]UVH54707.1 hypothetical protein NWF24_17830 [Variovorax paradoxus]
MEDLSHWDFAEHFKAKEVAELIAGIPPEKNTALFGVMGEEAKFVAKITPILRRMERAYAGAANLLNAAATWGGDAKESLRSFAAVPMYLESEPMTRVRSTDSGYGLSIFAEDIPDFGGAYFERAEVRRWLSAIGMKSVYSFGESPKEAKPELSSKEVRDRDMFSRLGDDREELHQWLVMDTWSMEAAMFLIAGVIPSKIYEGFGYFKVEGGLLHNGNGDKDARIAQIEGLERLWKSNPQHPSQAAPQYFFDWAESKGIDIPWLDAAKKAGYFQSAAAKQEEPDSIHPKVQKTLLTIIAVLCKEAKLDYSKPAKTAGLIRSTAEGMGISIGETTIEGHLKKIPDALETRMK